MNFDHKHPLSTSEARERIRALGEYLHSRHGIVTTWNDDNTASFKGRYLIVKIEGKFTLENGIVRLRCKDPGMLWRKKATNYLRGKLEIYLDPSSPLDSLQRS